MTNLRFKAEKEARPESDPKIIIPEKYNNLLDVFLKKNSDTVLSYQKYDY